MRLSTLRESLQPSIDELIRATDYWSEMTMRGKEGGHHYIMLVRVVQDLKNYILESERYERDEKLCVSCGTDGGLQQEPNDSMEDSGVERFG